MNRQEHVSLGTQCMGRIEIAHTHARESASRATVDLVVERQKGNANGTVTHLMAEAHKALMKSSERCGRVHGRQRSITYVRPKSATSSWCIRTARTSRRVFAWKWKITRDMKHYAVREFWGRLSTAISMSQPHKRQEFGENRPVNKFRQTISRVDRAVDFGEGKVARPEALLNA